MVLLCLSSGLEPQYRLDVLRLLALPRGATIQFRYEADIVPPAVREKLNSGGYKGKAALLAHVDCNLSAKLPNGDCKITPCRYSTVISSQKIGKFFFLRFCLEDFAVCEDLELVQRVITGPKPHWVSSNDREGAWCFELESPPCGRKDGLEQWQSIIAELYKSPDFSKEQYFFAVEGIYERGKTKKVSVSSGEFNLKAGKDYLLRLLDFHPDTGRAITGASVGKIETVISEPLSAITHPVMPIASPYDLKEFHFHAAAAVTDSFSSLAIRSLDSADKVLETQPELFVPIKISARKLQLAANTALLTVLLFFQQYIVASQKGEVPWGLKLAMVIVAALTAIFIVFVLKKPL